MHIDHTQTGSLSALTAKKTTGGFERKQAAQAVDRAPDTTAAKRPSILPLPDSKAAPGAPPSFPPTTAAPPTPEKLSVDELLKAWGEPDARYDLNGDGTVDMKDLMQLLSDLAHEDMPSEGDLISHPPTDVRSAGAPTPRSDLGADPVADPPAPPPSEVAATRTDLAGTIAATTFGALAPPRSESDGTSPRSLRPEPRVDRPSAADAETRRADQVARNLSEAKARFLLDQLERTGFEERPPQNLHELLDALDLNPKDRESLLDRLEARYPRGLGLNALA